MGGWWERQEKGEGGKERQIATSPCNRSLFLLLQLLMTVLTRGEVTEMMSLAVTAAQCMNKVAISKEIREFTHKGKAEGKLKEKVSFAATSFTS
jgi:hypothetical protein